MTILHVTDFHFNKTWFDWLLHSAPAHDLLVMSGNLLDRSHDTPHRRQIDWVSDWVRNFPGALSLCSGSHDLEWDTRARRWTPAYWLRDLSGPITWIDGQRVTLNNLSVLPIGCTTQPKGGEADVWVVNAPPSKTRVSTHANGDDGGDPDLSAAVRRHAPKLVLSGRVHDPARWCQLDGPTLYLNPGRNAHATHPNHIIVHTERMTCEFINAHEPKPRSADLPTSLGVVPASELAPAA